MILDTITLCIALAIGFIATGVVDATAIIPLWRQQQQDRTRDSSLRAGVRVLARIGRGI